ncbi:MAG: hypothetical protein KAR36_12565 [Candidatus Latescibacteria bacterium]|nr:hypothetical protein [Candidatus Latescibacterota bacterium]
MTDSNAPPIEIGSDKQLFIDQRFIESSHGVKLSINPPVKAEPVLVAETPIEGHRVGGYSTVIEADGRYLMYYTAIPNSAGDDNGQMICLATSDDGIAWKRERVGLYEVCGSRENNVVLPGCAGTVFLDPNEHEGSRFWWIGNSSENKWWNESKGTISSPTEACLYLMHSRDGICWKRFKEPVLPFGCDTVNQCFWDARLNKYVAYVRSWHPQRDRAVSRLEVDDLLETPWPHRPRNESEKKPWASALSSELPIVMAADDLDPPKTDLYTPCVSSYPWAQEVYLAFPSPYRRYDGLDSYGRDQRGTPGEHHNNDGPVEIACAVSRDGVRFDRFRAPYVPLGRIGEVDGGSMYMSCGMVRRGEEIYQYYGGTPFTHGDYELKRDCYMGVIRRVVQRLDGFVSADAQYTGGEIVTPLMRFEGTRLQLNVDCSALGEVWVELLDERNFPIEGFTMDDAVSVDRNGVAQEVWWKQGPDVSKLSGKPVRLRMRMRAAKLYAFQFVGDL